MKHKFLWGLFLFILAALLLVLPWGIGEIFYRTSGQYAAPRAEELTYYYGALLSVFLVIAAVVLAIRHGEKQLRTEREHEYDRLKDERKLEIQPFLASRFDQISPYDLIAKMGDYDVYFEMDPDEIRVGSGIPEWVGRVNSIVREEGTTVADEFASKRVARLILELLSDPLYPDKRRRGERDRDRPEAERKDAASPVCANGQPDDGH